KSIDAVICQSEDMAIHFMDSHKIPEKRISVINNPLSEQLPLYNKPTSHRPIKYITIVRLTKEKGHDRVLHILAEIPYPFQYTIIGRGLEKERINEKILDLGLKASITFIPFTSEIGKVLSEHDLFLQGSYVEGFPNAVLESCLVGTPVIAFNVPGGTKEIIRDEINGYLVSNNEDFIKKLESLNIITWEPKI